MGYEVHYASNFENPIYECDREALQRDGIICHHLSIDKSPFRIGKNKNALKQLRDLVQKEQIQAIHCNNPVGGLLGRIVDKNLYTIYTAHGLHFYKGAPLKNWLFFYPVEKHLAKKTDLFVTINKEDFERTKRFSIRTKNGYYQIPGVGVDTKRFTIAGGNRHIIRQELHIPKDATLFLSVGELNQNKNHIVLLKAFCEIRSSCENAYLYICGEGKKRKELQQFIQKNHLEERVKLCGYQKKIEEYYQAADVFLFPSYREGLGMASLEAMASGLPIIVADNRGTREYTKEENGYVCHPGKVGEFICAMEHLYKNPLLREEMGRESRKLIENFTIEKSTEIMRRVYEYMDRDLNNRYEEEKES